MNTSYRPHTAGHDYYAPGIYHITLVVRERRPLLSELGQDPRNPMVELTEVGKAVMECWQLMPEISAQRGRHVRLHAAVCMPDHFHGVVEVEERMDVSVGELIRSFKTGCTVRWHRLKKGTDARQLILADGVDDEATRDRLRRMSKRQRAEFYATHPDYQQPLWDDNYDDTICLTNPVTGLPDTRHKGAMIRYVKDNPRRAIMRHHLPQFMERRLHVRIAGRDYAAYGNLFLLRWARKVPVMFHRKAPDRRTPYTHTDAFIEKCRRLKAMVMEGQTAIITPGISEGEKIIYHRCLESGYPLIHLQKEPITAFWKPEQSRFDACIGGSLLILAPWHPEEIGEVNHVPSCMEFSIFHNLNMLAQEISETADMTILNT